MLTGVIQTMRVEEGIDLATFKDAYKEEKCAYHLETNQQEVSETTRSLC